MAGGESSALWISIGYATAANIWVVQRGTTYLTFHDTLIRAR